MKQSLRSPLIATAMAFVLSWAMPMDSHGIEQVTIPGEDGSKIEVSIHLPPDFDAAQAYSVLVGPGDYYWQDRPSQPGWIVALSDAFWGDGSLERAPRVLSWLSETYRVRNDGFHIAGWSRNSAGVFEIAMTNPDQILSVTGIAGMPGNGSEKDLGKLRGVRVQFIVGEKDTYWRQGSERWHKKLQDLGVHSTIEIIPNGAHVMPEIANEPIFERMNRLVAEIEAAKP